MLVVGSNYGGAVAAARLAGATRSEGTCIELHLLEPGQEYLRGVFLATFAELPGHGRLGQQEGKPARGRPEGLFDMRIGRNVDVLLGSGLGGGSLINIAVMKRPTTDAFEVLRARRTGFRASTAAGNRQTCASSIRLRSATKHWITCGSYGTIGDDSAGGRIEPDEPRNPKAGSTSALTDALCRAHESAGGRGGRCPGSARSTRDAFDSNGPNTSVHPLGGCPMADDFKDWRRRFASPPLHRQGGHVARSCGARRMAAT